MTILPTVIPILSDSDDDTPILLESKPSRRRRNSTPDLPGYKDTSLTAIIIPDFSLHPPLFLTIPSFRTPPEYDTIVPGLREVRPGEVVDPNLVVPNGDGPPLAWGYVTRYDALNGTDRARRKRVRVRERVKMEARMGEAWKQWETKNEDGWQEFKLEELEDVDPEVERIKRKSLREWETSRQQVMGRRETPGQSGGLEKRGGGSSDSRNRSMSIRLSETSLSEQRRGRDEIQRYRLPSTPIRLQRQPTTGQTLFSSLTPIELDDSDDEIQPRHEHTQLDTVELDDEGFERHERLLTPEPLQSYEERDSRSVSTISNQFPSTPPHQGHITPPPTNPHPDRSINPYIPALPTSPQPIFNTRKRTNTPTYQLCSLLSPPSTQPAKKVRLAPFSTPSTPHQLQRPSFPQAPLFALQNAPASKPAQLDLAALPTRPTLSAWRPKQAAFNSFFSTSSKIVPVASSPGPLLTSVTSKRATASRQPVKNYREPLKKCEASDLSEPVSASASRDRPTEAAWNGIVDWDWVDRQITDDEA